MNFTRIPESLVENTLHFVVACVPEASAGKPWEITEITSKKWSWQSWWMALSILSQAASPPACSFSIHLWIHKNKKSFAREQKSRQKRISEYFIASLGGLFACKKEYSRWERIKNGLSSSRERWLTWLCYSLAFSTHQRRSNIYLCRNFVALCAHLSNISYRLLCRSVDVSALRTHKLLPTCFSEGKNLPRTKSGRWKFLIYLLNFCCIQIYIFLSSCEQSFSFFFFC